MKEHAIKHAERVPTYSGQFYTFYENVKVYRLSRGVSYFLAVNDALWHKPEKMYRLAKNEKSRKIVDF